MWIEILLILRSSIVLTEDQPMYYESLWDHGEDIITSSMDDIRQSWVGIPNELGRIEPKYYSLLMTGCHIVGSSSAISDFTNFNIDWSALSTYLKPTLDVPGYFFPSIESLM